MRLPQENTTEWPADDILNHLYAGTAMSAWSPKSFRRYVRKQTRKVYHNASDDADNGGGDDKNSGDGDEDGDEDSDNGDHGGNDENDSAGGGPSHVNAQMVSQMGCSGSGRHGLRRRNKAKCFSPMKKRRVVDLMDGVFALWKQSSRVAKPKPEDARASTLARNEDIKVWLESVEGAGKD